LLKSKLAWPNNIIRQKMKILTPLILLCAGLLVGCSTTAHLYPIKGPLSEQVPLPLLKAKVDGIIGKTGNITIMMPDGEELRGRWSLAAGSGEAVLTGTKGTTLQVEFFTSGKNGSGVAKDNRGNIFKVIF
jgi:hypothetical protein